MWGSVPISLFRRVPVVSLWMAQDSRRHHLEGTSVNYMSFILLNGMSGGMGVLGLGEVARSQLHT